MKKLSKYIFIILFFVLTFCTNFCNAQTLDIINAQNYFEISQKKHEENILFNNKENSVIFINHKNTELLSKTSRNFSFGIPFAKTENPDVSKLNIFNFKENLAYLNVPINLTPLFENEICARAP